MLWDDLKGGIPMWDEGQLSALAGARVEVPSQEGESRRVKGQSRGGTHLWLRQQ